MGESGKLAAACSDGGTRVFDAESLSMSAEWFWHENNECATFITMIGTNDVVTTYSDGTYIISRIGIDSDTCLHKGKSECELWTSAFIDPYVMIPELFGRVRFLDAKTYEQVAMMKVSEDEITSITDKGIGTFGNELKLYDINTRSVLSTVPAPGGVWRHEVINEDYMLLACMQEGFWIHKGAEK